MRNALKRLAVGAALLVATASSVTMAQTHSELQSLVQQLQANPSDTALRERIITMARELKPAPAVPTEARDYFIRGTTIAKAATHASGQLLAVENFEKALAIAPWWGDALYNLAVAQDLAGQLDAAKAAFRLYAYSASTDQERQDALDRISAIEAKKQLAALRQQAAPKAEDLWNGLWTKENYAFGNNPVRTTERSRRTGDSIRFVEDGKEEAVGDIRGLIQPSGTVVWEISRYTNCKGIYWDPLQVTVSDGGRRLQYDQLVTDTSECRVRGPGTPVILTRQ